MTTKKVIRQITASDFSIIWHYNASSPDEQMKTRLGPLLADISCGRLPHHYLFVFGRLEIESVNVSLKVV